MEPQSLEVLVDQAVGVWYTVGCWNCTCVLSWLIQQEVQPNCSVKKAMVTVFPCLSGWSQHAFVSWARPICWSCSIKWASQWCALSALPWAIIGVPMPEIKQMERGTLQTWLTAKHRKSESGFLRCRQKMSFEASNGVLYAQWFWI